MRWVGLVLVGIFGVVLIATSDFGRGMLGILLLLALFALGCEDESKEAAE